MINQVVLEGRCIADPDIHLEKICYIEMILDSNQKIIPVRTYNITLRNLISKEVHKDDLIMIYGYLSTSIVNGSILPIVIATKLTK